MCKVVAWSAPDSMYQGRAARTPAARHRASSLVCVPDESPRDTKGPRAAAMRRNASAAPAAPATPAGSVVGPTTANRLATSGQRSEACSVPRRRASSDGACVMTTSRSPCAAERRICPDGPTTVASGGPVHSDSITARAPDVYHPVPRFSARPRTASMRILLAEDDPVTRATLQAVLAGQGHDVTEVENGRDAWGTWKLSAPRIVVADWVMPEMDGLELCRK